MMTARDFVELEAFARHETLDPEGWAQTAKLLQHVTGFGKGKGELLDPPERFLPTIPWPDEDDEE